MEGLFQKVSPESIQDNLFKLIGKDWMLLAAGKKDHYNMMTASWGTAGFLWGKPVVTIFVRPQRYTYEFIENNPYFSVSFLAEEHREFLNLCGTTSGRNMNKMEIEGLTAIATPVGTVSFEESRLVLECRKLYYDDIDPSLFQAFSLEKIYPRKDYHRFYIAEIVQAWTRK